MTVFYECDICGEVYEDEDQCMACEYSHEHAEHFKYIHLWRLDRTPVDFHFHDTYPQDIGIIRCETPDAWGVVENWFEYYGICAPSECCDYVDDDIVFWSVDSNCWKSVAQMGSLLGTYKKLCYEKEN